MGLATSLLAPVLPLNHVSELYAYSLLPILAVTFGLGTELLLRRLAPPGRYAAGVLLLLILFANGLALADDARRMAWNGRQAARLMPELLRHARSLPPGGHLTLVNPVPPLPEYSLYRMNNFRLCPPEEVLRLANRPDLTITLVDSAPPPGPVNPLELRLTLSESLALTPL